MKFHSAAVLMVLASVAAGVTPCALGQQAITPTREKEIDPQRAAQLSIEELMGMEVTSVAGVEQQVLTTPAAITVIDEDEVRRTGHRWVAEALRLAPGVYVGQSNTSSWSVGPRGFSGGLANKTLVLMDGRRVYDPIQAGTFWDVQDVLLEDLDRIEVIRGPGATLFGANAINGVINIVNKSTADTQGVFLEAGGGTFERGFGSVRYGGRINEKATYAVWAKYFNRAPLEAAGPLDSDSDFDLTHARFRTDIDAGDDLKLMFEADAYSSFGARAAARVPVRAPTATTERRIFENDVRGGHVLGRAERFTGDNEGWSVLAYYDRTERALTGSEAERDSAEIDARYHFMLGERHALATGIEYYFTTDRLVPGSSTLLTPGSPAADSMNTVSAFVQDTITLQEDRWFAMLGSKVEHNDLTGVEVQPSARLWWTPTDRETVWGAVSRAVRTPSRFEEHGFINFFFADPGVLAGGPPTGQIVPFGLSGNPNLDSEKALVYELGYRRRFSDRVTLDVATFLSQYDDLISIPTPAVGGSFNNNGEAEVYGGEVAVVWQAADNWRLRGAYSYAEVNVSGPVSLSDEGNTPHNMAQLQSFLDITENLELNAAAYFVDRVESQGASSYTRVDIGLTWRVTPNFDVSIWGQNLLEPRHNEFSSLQVERSAYVVATLRF
ncbi:MAG TPA: TonB-dependent receptor [Phycisphaerales bacterium]|nr:TonB-dependent receptor [Phycisphaerales bacterium]